MTASSSSHRRGGRRVRRAAHTAKRNERRHQALVLLDTVADSHFAAEFDPDGIWGISTEGQRLVDEAERLLSAAGADGSDVAARAGARLADFWFEYSTNDYVTERASAFFDEARAELRSR